MSVGVNANWDVHLLCCLSKRYHELANRLSMRICFRIMQKHVNAQRQYLIAWITVYPVTRLNIQPLQKDYHFKASMMVIRVLTIMPQSTLLFAIHATESCSYIHMKMNLYFEFMIIPTWVTGSISASGKKYTTVVIPAAFAFARVAGQLSSGEPSSRQHLILAHANELTKKKYIFRNTR